MRDSGPLSPLWSLVFLILALFYLYRMLWYRQHIRFFDAENEVGHAMMALGMAFMLTQLSGPPSDLVRWNIILFAAASLWWALRLWVQKPVCAFLLRQNGIFSSRQSDVFHMCMHAGMAYMFSLMSSSMTLSMTPYASICISLFALFFAFLTCFYGQEIVRILSIANRDWFQCGASLAHALMSGVMCWMFLEMLMMTISMNAL
jgi:hypothetical protein